MVANADEPLIVWAAQTARRVVWVNTAGTWIQDASLCPSCGSVLVRHQPDEHRAVQLGVHAAATWRSRAATTR